MIEEKMDDSSLNRPFQFFFLSLALLWCFSFADLIDDVCSQTQNPSFCSKALRSDPGSRGADLKGLGQISIKLSTNSVQATATQLLPKLKNGSSGRLKGIYDTCLETYGDSVDNIRDASDDLNSSDFLGMNLKASAAEDDVGTCDDSFTEAGLSEPEELNRAGKNASDLIGIVLVVANRLRG